MGTSFTIFFIISVTITDEIGSGMTWGATLIVPQALEWGISVDKSATTMNYGMLLQGVGGLMAIPLIEAYGRCVVILVCVTSWQ